MITDNLKRKDGTKRFRISEHDMGGAIIQKDLKRLNIKHYSQMLEEAVVIKIQNEESEIIKHEIMYDPFRINMSIDGETLIVVNEGDSMLFEDYRIFQDKNDDHFQENKQEIVTIDNIQKDAMTPIIDKMSAYSQLVYFGKSSFDDMWLSSYLSTLLIE